MNLQPVQCALVRNVNSENRENVCKGLGVKLSGHTFTTNRGDRPMFTFSDAQIPNSGGANIANHSFSQR